MKIEIGRWLKKRYLTFIRLKDDPRLLAKGVAIGIALDFLPTFGLGLIGAYFIAILLRANRIAAVLSAVVFKLGIPFFYILNIIVGRTLLGKNINVPMDTPAKQSLFHFSGFSDLSYAFLIGSVINTIFVSVTVYYIVLKFLHLRKERKMAKRR